MTPRPSCVTPPMGSRMLHDPLPDGASEATVEREHGTTPPAPPDGRAGAVASRHPHQIAPLVAGAALGLGA